MAAMVSTEATMDKWVMKLVNLQKLAPKIQSLESFNSFVISKFVKNNIFDKLLFLIQYMKHTPQARYSEQTTSPSSKIKNYFPKKN